MAIKQMTTVKPVRYKKDKKGNLIPVYRAGWKDTNKYAKKSARQQRDEANIGNKNYDPDKPETHRKEK